MGAQFQVNTYTTNDQKGAKVEADTDGDFVVVWHSPGSAGTDSSSYSVQGMRYLSDGSTIGGEFQVNTYTTAVQWYPSVSLDGDGDFVVVWSSLGSTGTDTDQDSIQRSEAAQVPVELQRFIIE